MWLHANDADRPIYGFEKGDHTVVRYGIDPATGRHRFSSRALPAGYAARPGSTPPLPTQPGEPR